VVQEAVRAHRPKTLSEIIDFYISQQVTFSEKNAKKEAKTLK
jgi:hypothetical protein